MHHFPVITIHATPAPTPRHRLIQTLSLWCRRCWLAYCAQAERPTRRIPYY